MGFQVAWNYESEAELIHGDANTLHPEQELIQWCSFDSMIRVQCHLQTIAFGIHTIQDKRIQRTECA
ncbi:hypothetical protein Plhal703r1_c13g0065321 [Plasmopara halstedii]